MFAAPRSIPALLVAAAALSVPAAAQVARPSIQIDTTTAAGLRIDDTDVATAGDLSVVIYADRSTPASVWATTSDAFGTTWSTPVQVDSDSTGAIKQVGYMNERHNVVIVGDSIYTVWLDDRNAAETDVYFARSTDRGVTWAEQQLDKGFAAGSGALATEYCFEVEPDAAGDKIYVAIQVDNGVDDELKFVSSLDGGLTFSSAIDVSTLNGVEDVDDFTLCAEGSTVHVAFTDGRSGALNLDELFYRRSTDSGQTFGPEVQLDGSGPQVGDLAGNMAMACEGNLLLIAYQEELADPANEEIRARVSLDGGLTFQPDVLVSDYDPTSGVDGDAPAATICGGNLIVGWDDNRTTVDAVYVSVSTDGGLTWSSAEQLSNDEGPGFVRFDSDGASTVVLSNEAGAAPSGVESVWSGDCGLSWSSFDLISDTTGDADNTRIVYNAQEENAIAVWMSDDLGDNNGYVGGYSLCEAGAMVSRNGGTNPNSYTAVIPQLGATFTASVDMTATGHGFALLVGFGSPLNLPVGNGRVLLVNIADPGGELLGLSTVAGPVASFQLLLPSEPSFCGLTVSTQALHFGGPPYVLSNALDLTLTGI